MIFAFRVIASHTNLFPRNFYDLNIFPKKARGPDWNLSRARSGPRAGLWGSL